jgi:rare lipoprotein A
MSVDIAPEAGERMANGKRFDPTAMTCPSRTYPLNTILQVTSAHSKKKVIVTVTERGPWVNGLSIDLFKGAANEIGMIGQGVELVIIEPYSSHNYTIEKDSNGTNR